MTALSLFTTANTRVPPQEYRGLPTPTPQRGDTVIIFSSSDLLDEGVGD